MENFVQSRYQTLLKDIDSLPEIKNLPVKKPASVAEIVGNAISDLKNHFTSFPFADNFEEIRFFKYQKPLFMAESVYSAEIFTVESNRPHGDPAIIRSYYEQELRFTKRFFDQYRFMYQYYLLDGIELDTIYFTSGAKNSELFIPESSWTDSGFSAPGDFVFAKFIGLERIQDFLIRRLYPGMDGDASIRTKERHKLTWTGDKINLVEIAYAIRDTSQINQGKADIIDVINWLEDSLNVSLSRHYRMFSEIKSRKSVSRTRYIDHMKAMLLSHLEEGDAFRPVPPNTVSGSKSILNK